MLNLTRRVGAAVVGGAIGFGALTAMADQPATQPSNQDLQAQIQQLKSQVAELKSNQQQQSQADEEQAVKEVTSEADQNSQLLDTGSGLSAGWDPSAYKFYLSSDDGNFYLHPGFWTQVRYVASYKSSPENWQDGFEIRCG
jgi:TolA-binding protein